MITQEAFLEKYNKSKTDFDKTGLEWKQLKAIHTAYEESLATLEPTVAMLAAQLRTAPKVHTIKTRLKDPEHLIEKIIREKLATPILDVTPDNYDSAITDLVGLRALHLFKEDWTAIHDWITTYMNVKEKPLVYIRDGDPEEHFKEKGCDVKEHPCGYRSAHYIVACKPSLKVVLAEIQVRTIFEEGWSEIDHLIRYPYVDNPILKQYLVMFNRLAGNADDMGTFLLYLKAQLEKQDETKKKLEAELKDKNAELGRIIKKLTISDAEKEELQDRISALSKSNLEYALPSLKAGVLPADLYPTDYAAGVLPADLYPTDYAAFQMPGRRCIICGGEIPFSSFTSVLTSIDGKCDNCRNRFGIGGSPGQL